MQGRTLLPGPLPWPRPWATTNDRCGMVEAWEAGGVQSRTCDCQATSAGPGPLVKPLTSIVPGFYKDGTGSVQLRKPLLSTCYTWSSVLGPLGPVRSPVEGM